MWRSDDGESWQVLARIGVTSYLDLVVPIDRSTVLAVTGEGGLLVTEQGQQQVELPMGKDDRSLGGEFSDAEHGWLLVTSPARLLATEDGGRTWAPVELSRSPTDVGAFPAPGADDPPTTRSCRCCAAGWSAWLARVVRQTCSTSSARPPAPGSRPPSPSRRPAQVGAWQAVSAGAHALVVAPTGSGKTLSAFLWSLDRIAAARYGRGRSERCRVLYVSPLKALAVDVERNLRAPLAGIRATPDGCGARARPHRRHPLRRHPRDASGATWRQPRRTS